MPARVARRGAGVVASVPTTPAVRAVRAVLRARSARRRSRTPAGGSALPHNRDRDRSRSRCGSRRRAAGCPAGLDPNRGWSARQSPPRSVLRDEKVGIRTSFAPSLMSFTVARYPASTRRAPDCALQRNTNSRKRTGPTEEAIDDEAGRRTGEHRARQVARRPRLRVPRARPRRPGQRARRPRHRARSRHRDLPVPRLGPRFRRGRGRRPAARELRARTAREAAAR